jgi:F0F1-type ATP synthase membrane subunit b/b'
MGAGLYINIAITLLSLGVITYYFNYREKKISGVASKKLKDIKQLYVAQLTDRKMKEKQEIEKLKKVVDNIEKKHRDFVKQQNSKLKEHYLAEAEVIIKKAEERAKKIEAEVKEDAKHFLEEQKKEVQTKMVDLVMGVAKKVLSKSLTHDEHKELIEKALLEMEGEIGHDARN